ncbi:26421_t:CDS:2, partial [Gigaspora margarita]
MQEQDDTTDSEYEERKSIEPNKIPTLPELLVYEPMKDIKEFHKSYTILPHGMQR